MVSSGPEASDGCAGSLAGTTPQTRADRRYPTAGWRAVGGVARGSGDGAATPRDRPINAADYAAKLQLKHDFEFPSGTAGIDLTSTNTSRQTSSATRHTMLTRSRESASVHTLQL